MATITPVAYNLGSPIGGTTQYGNLAVGDTPQDYGASPGGVTFWSTPDLDIYYVIAKPIPAGNQPNPLAVPAYVGFNASPISGGTIEFINLANVLTGQNFTGATEAKVWLESNGYWTSYGVSLCDSFTFIGNNATTTTNSAINDGTSGWDSSAYSLETFTGPVSVTFQTSANGNILMGGFSLTTQLLTLETHM